MRLLLSLSLATLTVMIGSPALAASASTTPGDHGILLAQKTKKKAKKKKKSDDGETDFGPGDIEPMTHEETSGGASSHREQEGIDRPYFAEASGLTSVSMLTTTSGSGDPVKGTDIGIGGEFLFILGSMEVGPALSYSTMSTSSTTTDSTSGAKTTVDIKTTDIGIGGVFKWNFGNIDHADLVPFAYGGIGLLMGDSKYGDLDAVKTSGNEVRVGGGVNFFLDSNVSFQPRAQYIMRSRKADTEGAEEVKTSGLEILFALGTFI